MFESLVLKPHDLIENITYGFYDKPSSESVIVKPEFPNDVLSSLDRQSYGRCFVAKPTSEMIRNGIKWVRIYGKASIAVSIHSPSILETVKKPSKVDVSVGAFKVYQVNHEVQESVEVNQKPCNPTVGYNKDYCEDVSFQKEALKLYGCTTPFGPYKSRICNHTDIHSKDVAEMWKNFNEEGRYTHSI